MAKIDRQTDGQTDTHVHKSYSEYQNMTLPTYVEGKEQNITKLHPMLLHHSRHNLPVDIITVVDPGFPVGATTPQRVSRSVATNFRKIIA